MSTSFTITERNGCRLVSGSIPLSSFGMLTHNMPKNAVISPHVARLLNVSFAIGDPAKLKALAEQPDVIQAARERAREIGSGLSEAEIEWLALGEHGSSSLTIFEALSGKKVADRPSHPLDADDFRRCRLLVEAVPEYRGRIHEIAAVSPVWKRLVPQWDDLCALMDQETPEWRKGGGKAKQLSARLRKLAD